MLVNEQRDTSQAESEILHPGSRALFRFWESMRGESSAPAKSNLDLTRIRDLIPNLLIIDRNPVGRSFRWRLAGTQICSLYARELTGTPVLTGWDSFETGVVARFLASVDERLQPCLLRFRMRTDLSQLIGVEMIGLPLQAIDGKAIHIFGGMFPFRETATLAHNAITAMELSGARSIWTEHLPGDQLVRQLEKSPPGPFQPFQVIKGGRGRKGTGNGEVDRSTRFHVRSDDLVPLAVKLFALNLQFSQFLL